MGKGAHHDIPRVLQDIMYEWTMDDKGNRVRRWELLVRRWAEIGMTGDERTAIQAIKGLAEYIESKPKQEMDITTDGEKLQAVVFLPKNGLEKTDDTNTGDEK